MKAFYVKIAFGICVFIAILGIYFVFGRAEIPSQGYIEIRRM